MKKTMENTLAIKRFIYKGKCYFYDAYTNRLFGVTNEQYIELSQLEAMGLEKYACLEKNTKQYNDIMLLIRKGIFSPLPIKKIEHPMTEYVDYLFKRSVNYLILQVTCDCNFKCRYCLFASDSGDKIGLGHKKLYMEWETAKQSIDFLYENSKDAPEIIIAFYGGEPFLNFDIIKKAVNYAENKFITKRINYYITTNGSILTDEIIDFIIEHNIVLTISLDGSEKTQNKHRKFYETGNNTFEIVWRNTIKLRDKNNQYFLDNVRFNPVVFLDEKYQDVIDFFESNGIPQDNINGQYANIEGIDYTYTNDNNIQSNIDDQKEMKLKINQNEFNIKKGVYESKSVLPEVWHHGGTCIPGVLRLYVNVNGDFYPCEKTNSSFSIGNLNKGFDSINIKKALNIGKITEEECKKCWMLRFCKICIAQCTDITSGKISKTKKLLYCNSQKKSVELFFKNYIDMKEQEDI